MLVLICFGALSIYLGRVIRVYRAQRYADSLQADAVEHAMRLAPDDAEFPHLLGIRLSASDQDDEAAIANLRKAVALNPNSARYWLDLASVYQVTGNVEKQNEAVQAAITAEPGNPEIAAEAARSFMVDGDVSRALPLFRQALAQNPEAAQAILPLCWRQTKNASLILNEVIPDSPELQIEFLGLLARQKETDAASQVWQYLIASHKYFQPRLSFFYFNYLIQEHDVAGLERAWHDLAGIAPDIRAYVPNDNLIVNSGFEQPLLNSGFDWRHEPSDHVSSGIDDKVAHSGSHSLSLVFDGGPAYLGGWAQFVPVRPNTDYEFSAWIKSENVTSSSGPRFSLVDAYSGVSLLLTDDVLDTHSWQEIKGTFHVPASTTLLTVLITRAPADTRIRGRVWIDDLRLVQR